MRNGRAGSGEATKQHRGRDPSDAPQLAVSSPGRCVACGSAFRLRRSRPAYALAMTLLLLVLAAVALAAVARGSLGRALAAVDAAEGLQRHWGTLTLAAALEGRVEPLLAEAGVEAEKKQEPALALLRAELKLGEQAFVVILADEQAKVNLNALRQRLEDPRAAEQVVRRLLREMNQDQARLRTEAFAEGTGGDGNAAQWQTWDELFDGATPQRLFGRAVARPPPAVRGRREAQPLSAELTLWGDGKLNFRRASPLALETVTAPVLGMSDVQRLHRLRRDQPGIGLDESLAQLELSEEKREELGQLLGEGSACHSIAVTARGRHRAWHRLVILEGAGEGGVQRKDLVW